MGWIEFPPCSGGTSLKSPAVLACVGWQGELDLLSAV